MIRAADESEEKINWTYTDGCNKYFEFKSIVNKNIRTKTK